MGRRTAVGALALGLAFLAHVVWLAVVAEDAYISFRFARNLVAGAGLVWNVGEAPVEGYTNFLWVLLSALFQWVGVAPGPGAQVVGTLAGLATLGVVFAWGRRLGWSAGVALLPCAALVLAGPFATWAASGLETSLFTLLVWAGLLCFLLYWEDGRAGLLVPAFALLALAVLTRPEGVLALGLVLAWAAAAPAERRPVLLRDLAGPAGAALVLLAAYGAWRWSYFGEPLPNTFYAKTSASLAQVSRGAAYGAAFSRDFLLPWLPLLLLAAAAPAASRRRGAPVLLPAAFVLLWSLYVVAIGGDYMAMYRFFVPALPGLALLVGAGARRVLAAPEPRTALLAVVLALGGLGTLLQSTPLQARLLPEPRRWHGNWRGVQTERWQVRRLTAIGELFAGYGRPGESIGTDAIGAIGWYSGLGVYGVHGLVDPVIAREPRRNPNIGGGWAGHDRRDLARLFAHRPTFVMFNRKLRPTRPAGAELQSDVDPQLAGEYRLVSLWLEDFANGEAGWFSFLERRDRGGPSP